MSDDDVIAPNLESVVGATQSHSTSGLTHVTPHLRVTFPSTPRPAFLYFRKSSNQRFELVSFRDDGANVEEPDGEGDRGGAMIQSTSCDGERAIRRSAPSHRRSPCLEGSNIHRAAQLMSRFFHNGFPSSLPDGEKKPGRKRVCGGFAVIVHQVHVRMSRLVSGHVDGLDPSDEHLAHPVHRHANDGEVPDRVQKLPMTHFFPPRRHGVRDAFSRPSPPRELNEIFQRLAIFERVDPRYESVAMHVRQHAVQKSLGATQHGTGYASALVMRAPRVERLKRSKFTHTLHRAPYSSFRTNVKSPTGPDVRDDDA